MSDYIYAKVMAEGTPNYKYPWMLQVAKNMANATQKIYDARHHMAPKSVLDLGCGVGEYTNILERYKFNCIGLDKNKCLIEFASKRNNNVIYKACDITEVMFEEKFGVISATHEVFNIIKDYKLLLDKYKINLHERGFMIFDIITPLGFETWQDVQIQERNDFLMIQKCMYKKDQKIGTVKLTGFVQNGYQYDRFDVLTDVYNHDIQEILEYVQKLGFNFQLYHEWDDFTKTGITTYDNKFIDVLTKVYCVLTKK